LGEAVDEAIDQRFNRRMNHENKWTPGNAHYEENLFSKFAKRNSLGEASAVGSYNVSIMMVLSCAPEDTTRAEKFYRAFEEAELEPWMDSEDRPLGELWERALSVAVHRCELLILFLSEHSVDRYGLLQKGLTQALNDWEKKESHEAYVVLVRLEACKIPKQLADFQKFDALDESKIPELVRLLRVLNGKASGNFDFLPPQLEAFKLIPISSERRTHFDIGVTIPQFNDEDQNDILCPVNDLIERTVRDILEAFVGAEPLQSPEEIHELGLEKFPNDGFWLQPSILTATRSLISIEFYISIYRRGEEDRQHYTRTLNIDVDNCSELFLKDIVNNQDFAVRFFSVYCHNALMADPAFRLAEKDWKFDSMGISPIQSFGFRRADLIFIFAPRQLGPSILSRKLVEIPFSDVYRFLTNRTINLLLGQRKSADFHRDRDGR